MVLTRFGDGRIRDRECFWLVRVVVFPRSSVAWTEMVRAGVCGFGIFFVWVYSAVDCGKRAL